MGMSRYIPHIFPVREHNTKMCSSDILGGGHLEGTFEAMIEWGCHVASPTFFQLENTTHKCAHLRSRGGALGKHL